MTSIGGWWNYPEDEHGNFKYTLRQYLLMRRLNLGGEWTDVVKDVDHECRTHSEWDVEAHNTYRDWQAWYDGTATGPIRVLV